MDNKTELTPEAQAIIGASRLGRMAGMPFLTAEEYLRLTAHYDDRPDNELAAPDVDCEVPVVGPEAEPVVHVSFDMDDPSNPLAALNYAMERLFGPSRAST